MLGGPHILTFLEEQACPEPAQCLPCPGLQHPISCPPPGESLGHLCPWGTIRPTPSPSVFPFLSSPGTA